MYKFRAYQVVLHIAGWLLFMSLPLLFINGGQNSLISMLSKPVYWLFCLTYVVLFYLNSYILIPQLFLKRKYVWYTFITLLLLAGSYFLKPYDRLIRGEMDKNIMAPRHGPPMHELLSGYHMPGPPSYYRDTPDGKHTRSDDNCDTCRLSDLSQKSIKNGGGIPEAYNDKTPYLQPSQHFGNHRPFDTVSFFIFLMIIALSTAIKIMQQWQMAEHHITQAEADKASAELSFLKAQINPHFLFNTLNNIYTLAVMKDDNAPDSLLKLSNIMRYVTDDATQDFVPLVHEIDCINDYIELQRLRLGEKTQLDLEVSGDVENKKIPPLILMTFIENIFKYGVSKHHPSAIVVKLKSDDTGISFFCQNRIFPKKDEKRRVGIGLKNTQKRLAHLYPGKYILNINTDNLLYTVKLILQTT